VKYGPHAALAEQEHTKERRLREEREDAFHEQRLADDRARELREARPVRAELKLHRDPGDDPRGKRDGEDARPESRGVAVLFPAAEVLNCLEDRDQYAQPHREDGEEVVEHDRERELHPRRDQGVLHQPIRADCRTTLMTGISPSTTTRRRSR
jgi:hypothetical protein